MYVRNVKYFVGTCELQFDAVFDWVRKVYLPNGATHWKYNTYFFRKGWYWLYENRYRILKVTFTCFVKLFEVKTQRFLK